MKRDVVTNKKFTVKNVKTTKIETKIKIKSIHNIKNFAVINENKLFVYNNNKFVSIVINAKIKH